MGVDAVRKQAESKVLLIGLKPLGLEIAKNLVLSGLKQLTIVEKDKLEMIMMYVILHVGKMKSDLEEFAHA